MGQYQTGKASVTNASPLVSGQDTAWLANVAAGDYFSILGEGVWYEILSVTDDTHLTLKTNYIGTTKSVVAYLAQVDFTPLAAFPLISTGDQDTASLISLAFNSIDQKLNALQTALTGVTTLTLTGADLTIDVSALTSLTLGGAFSAASSTISGALIAGSISTSGALSAGSISTSGTLSSGALTATFGTFTQVVSLTAIGAELNIGSGSTSNFPLIDFRSSGLSPNYDVRIVASGGTSSDGNGALTIIGANIGFSGDISANSLNVNTGFSAVSGDPFIWLQKADGGANWIYGANSAGKVRWVMQFGNATAETGSNTGSDFYIKNYNDAGVVMSNAFSIERSTGIATFGNGLRADAMGMRNRIINGGMRVWQRGTSFTIANTANAYTADRWIALNGAGVSMTVDRQAPLAGMRGQFALHVAATGVAATKIIEFYHKWEGELLADMDSVAAVMSFDVSGVTSAGSLSGNFAIVCCTGLDNGVYTNTIYNAGFTVPGGTGSKVTIKLTAAQMAAVKNGGQLVWRFTQNTSTGNVAIYMSAVQWEKGVVDNVFEYRPYAHELILCQRFFQRWTQPALRGVVNSGTGASGLAMTLPVIMRATPTLALSASGALQCYDGGVSGSITSIGTNFCNPGVIAFDAVLGGATFTAGRALITFQSGTGYLDVFAELS